MTCGISYLHSGLALRFRWRQAVIGVAVLLGASLPGWSQVPMPEALKNIPRADGVCRPDSADAKRADVLAARAGEKPDLSCGMTLSEAGTLLDRPDTVLVDLRPASDFAQYHADRAVNLDAAALRSKLYLKPKPILLMGSGKNERERYVACGTLKRAGFKRVHVLRGGMPAWLAAGMTVVGRALGAAPVTLSAEELWAEAQFEGNVVLLGASLGAIEHQLPFSATVQSWTPDAVKRVLERRRKALRNIPLAAVIVAAGDETLTEAQLSSLQQASGAPVLVYTGTNAAFERAMTVQKAIWTAEARGPKQPGCGF